MYNKITESELLGNIALFDYLCNATLKVADRGGVFVGTKTQAPQELAKFGIILPRGGLILPEEDLAELKTLLRRVAQFLEELRKALETEEKERALARLMGAKERLMPRVAHLIETLASCGVPHGAIGAIQWGEDEASWGARANLEGFESSIKLELVGLPGVYIGHRVFEWTEPALAELESIIEGWVSQTKARREEIWKRFIEQNGVFTIKVVSVLCNVSKKFGAAMVGRDGGSEEWEETKYFLGDSEVAEWEHKWLKSRSAEVLTPTGWVRVDSATNEAIPVPEMPGQNDVLQINYIDPKIPGWVQSLYTGHPARCKIDLSSRRVLNQLNGVYLNGFKVEGTLDLDKWKNPLKLAEWGLKEAGFTQPTKEQIEAVGKVYSERLEKNK